MLSRYVLMYRTVHNEYNSYYTLITKDNKYIIENKTAVFLPPETEYSFDIKFMKNSSLIIFNFDLTNRNRHLQKSLSTATKNNFDKSFTPPYEHIERLNTPTVIIMILLLQRLRLPILQ